MDIGRKSRIWPNAMSRAIKERDQHCQFPGCTRTHHLQIHHITHWADGGATSTSNGACLCAYHHMIVHEGGYTIEHATDNEQRMSEQFEQQRHANDASLFDVEKRLRNNRGSFDTIRKLSPTRYRFRIMNAQGVDVRAVYSTAVGFDSPGFNLMDTRNSSDSSRPPISYQPPHSTRVECAEPKYVVYQYNESEDRTEFITRLPVVDSATPAICL